MRLYVHTGGGHWIGSAIVFTSENMESAERLAREWLNMSGLPDEPLNLVEHEILGSQIFYSANGDY